jgi:hypothetical protein
MPGYQTITAVAIGIAFVLASFAIAGRIISKTTTSTDVEIVKMRFAQVMFIGILVTFIFTSVLYMFSETGPGKEIFEKAVTGMTPLAGVIIGYLFGTKNLAANLDKKPGSKDPTSDSVVADKPPHNS